MLIHIRQRMNQHGQATAEFAVLIALVIGAFMTMNTYMKRGLQGRIKGAMDGIDVAGTTGEAQYEPYYLTSTSNVTQGQNITEGYAQGTVTRSGITTVDRTGTETEGGAEMLRNDDAW